MRKGEEVQQASLIFAKIVILIENEYIRAEKEYKNLYYIPKKNRIRL